MAKVKTVEIQIKSLTYSYRLTPGLVCQIQIANVKSIIFYGAEL